MHFQPVRGWPCITGLGKRNADPFRDPVQQRFYREKEYFIIVSIISRVLMAQL